MSALRFSAAFVLLALCSVTNMQAQVDTTIRDAPVAISLAPDKKTIMLGEPLYIAFEVRNLSGETLYVAVGGDYRNIFGRPESFKVTQRLSRVKTKEALAVLRKLLGDENEDVRKAAKESLTQTEQQ